MDTCIALTLGPITRVISLAQTTRGMWAASYLFSYLAKHIIEPFKGRRFLLPYLEDNLFSSKYDGAGVFPDRYIFEAEDGDFDKLAATIESVIGDLAEKIAPHDKDIAKIMLLQYFKFYFLEINREKGEENKSLVKRSEQRLALLEQRDSFISSVPKGKNYLSGFINSERLEPMRFLLDDAGIGKFKSIVNISTGNDGWGKIIEPDASKPYERYIAIVYGDGDSMGVALKDVEDSNTLSKQLLQFNVDAISTIKSFGGQTVYIGGDDLFFFAPVYNPDKKQSIFTLLDALDKSFHTALGEKSPATLSFGVSITYYKYPMQEAVRLSQALLDKAKGKVGSVQVDKPIKNNVLFAIQKHSGQTRTALLHKGCEKTVKKINELIDKYIVAGDENDLLLVSSVMHNLREHEPILLNAVGDDKLLENYFSNNYNEPSHGQFKGFFDDVYNLLKIAYSEYSDKTDRLKKSLEIPIEARVVGHDVAYASIDLCYSVLQFIHLVNLKKK